MKQSISLDKPHKTHSSVQEYHFLQQYLQRTNTYIARSNNIEILNILETQTQPILLQTHALEKYLKPMRERKLQILPPNLEENFKGYQPIAEAQVSAENKTSEVLWISKNFQVTQREVRYSRVSLIRRVIQHPQNSKNVKMNNITEESSECKDNTRRHSLKYVTQPSLWPQLNIRGWKECERTYTSRPGESS